VQEIVARYQVARDSEMVAKNVNARTQSIMAVQEAGRAAVQAAQQVNQDQFDQADKQLAAAEQKLRDTAKQIKSETERKRVEAAAASMARARQSTKAAAAAPAPAKPAAKRATALDVNAAGMHEMGY
jgi:Ca-activated chloride channel family protein